MEENDLWIPKALHPFLEVSQRLLLVSDFDRFDHAINSQDTNAWAQL